jgi:hypothetical protein
MFTCSGSRLYSLVHFTPCKTHGRHYTIIVLVSNDDMSPVYMHTYTPGVFYPWGYICAFTCVLICSGGSRICNMGGDWPLRKGGLGVLPPPNIFENVDRSRRHLRHFWVHLQHTTISILLRQFIEQIVCCLSTTLIPVSLLRQTLALDRLWPGS